MNVNMTVKTKANAKVYLTIGGSDALESDATLPPLVEAVEDGHEDVRDRQGESRHERLDAAPPWSSGRRRTRRSRGR